MSDETLLVSSMGTGGETGYSETDYALDGETHRTKFSPIALAELVETDPPEPVTIDRALIARTELAADAYDDELKQELEQADVPCEFEDISDVQNREEIDDLMQGLIGMIRERDPARVVLDITYGFRTLPMVFFATVIHLDALDDIEIARVYYGQYGGEDDESPIIDMTYLHTLMEWYHAVNTFERGELRPVHALLDERKEELFLDQEYGRPTGLAEVSKYLGRTSRHLDAGLPLQAGTEARSALDALERIDSSQFIGPEERFVDPLSTLLERIAVKESDHSWNEIQIDEDEIERQKEIVEFYIENNRYRVALSCARELFIN